MTIKRIQELRNRIKNCRSFNSYETHVCIGYGAQDYDNLNDRFGIPCMEIYTLYSRYPEEGLNSNWTGSVPDKLYYVSNEFYNKYIKEEPIMTPEEVYKTQAKAFFEAMGIKKGSLVKVTHIAKSRSNGWENSWVPSMDNTVGNTYTVDTTCERTGQVYLEGNDLGFPYFVFIPSTDKPIEVPKPIAISASYAVVFKEDASIEVGCQKISYEKLMEICKAVESVKAQLK